MSDISEKNTLKLLLGVAVLLLSVLCACNWTMQHLPQYYYAALIAMRIGAAIFLIGVMLPAIIYLAVNWSYPAHDQRTHELLEELLEEQRRGRKTRD
jgi:uncharacterized membrane protein YczE